MTGRTRCHCEAEAMQGPGDVHSAGNRPAWCFTRPGRRPDWRSLLGDLGHSRRRPHGAGQPSRQRCSRWRLSPHGGEAPISVMVDGTSGVVASVPGSSAPTTFTITTGNPATTDTVDEVLATTHVPPRAGPGPPGLGGYLWVTRSWSWGPSPGRTRSTPRPWRCRRPATPA